MKIKKKLKKFFFIQFLLALIATIYILFVRITSKINVERNDKVEALWNNNKPFILAFWHNQLMMIRFAWPYNKKLNILASGHSDGRFGSIIANLLGLKNIKTSDNNKNISLRPIFKLIKFKQYIAITPDGPRGPKEIVSEGIIRIAKTNNIPIIPIGFWSSKNSKLKSWDSFLITYPFSKCSFVWGEEINIPRGANENEILRFQKILEKKINECVKKAKENSK